MSRLGVPYWLIIIAALAAFLSGCEFNRQNDETGDIAAPEFSPPQLPPAQEPALIRLEPATQQLGIGATPTVEIRVDNVNELFAIDLWIQFNPDLLQVQDANPDEEGFQIQVGDFLPVGFIVANEADNATGDIFLTFSQIGPPVSGSGLLATINFQTTAAGTSELIFAQTDLTTNQGQPIAVTAQSGQIIVTGEASTPIAEATATETPISSEPTATLTTVPDQVTPTFTPTTTLVLPPTSSPQQPVAPSAPESGASAATPAAPIQTQPPTTLPGSSGQQPPAGSVLTQVPPGATTGFCFRVRTEHSLREVAETIRMEKGIEVNPRHIDIANDLYPPGYVFIQQVLFIPTEMGHGPNFLIVEQNNTSLSQIAEQCFLPLDFVAQVNKLPESAVLQAGNVVEIPRPPFPPPSRYRYPQSVFPGPYY